MVTRGDIVWAELGPPAGRRPVCVLTRDAAIEVLTAVTCAPITRTIRGIRSEVEVGPDQGLPETSVINCDSLLAVPKGQLAQSDGWISRVASTLTRRSDMRSTSSTDSSPADCAPSAPAGGRRLGAARHRVVAMRCP